MPQNDQIASLELDKYNQSHLVAFLDRLSPLEQKNLLEEIKEINLKRVCEAFARVDPSKAGGKGEDEHIDDLLEPLDSSIHQCISRTAPEQVEKWRNLGLQEIAKGKVAALLLAGGQGTRLGSSNPKGMYNVGLPSGRTLFQIQAERLLKLQELAKALTGQECSIPWYIMTSGPTIEATVEFFKKNTYFGLNPNNVIIFEQFTLPCFAFDGRIILDQPGKIARAPNGNGGLYEALRARGILADMASRGVHHVHVYCVDNILVKIADPIFVGYCSEKRVDCAAKVVEKVFPNEALGIICKVRGKYRVVEYSEVSHSTAQKRAPDGRLLFNAGNICNHYFTLDFLTNTVKEDQLKNHIAKKKIPFINERGERIQPDKPNGIKLEKFVFDVFEFSKNFAVLEVLREDEFSPLKNNDSCDKDTPTTARLSLYNLHQRYVLNAGGKFVDENGQQVPLIPSPALADVVCSSSPDSNNNSHVDNQVVCEISPLTSYDGEGLTSLVQGKCFQSPLSL